MSRFRQSANTQWAACVCLLCLTTAFLSAQYLGQTGTALHAGTPHTVPNRLSLRLFSKRLLLENSASSANVTSAPEAKARAPAIPSKPTILQAADVTFRLVGSDAQPFSNATAQALQNALHSVFSNFSSVAFAFQSAVVRTLTQHCKCAYGVVRMLYLHHHGNCIWALPTLLDDKSRTPVLNCLHTVYDVPFSSMYKSSTTGTENMWQHQFAFFPMLSPKT